MPTYTNHREYDTDYTSRIYQEARRLGCIPSRLGIIKKQQKSADSDDESQVRYTGLKTRKQYLTAKQQKPTRPTSYNIDFRINQFRQDQQKQNSTVNLDKGNRTYHRTLPENHRASKHENQVLDRPTSLKNYGVSYKNSAEKRTPTCLNQRVGGNRQNHIDVQNNSSRRDDNNTNQWIRKHYGYYFREEIIPDNNQENYYFPEDEYLIEQNQIENFGYQYDQGESIQGSHQKDHSRIFKNRDYFNYDQKSLERYSPTDDDRCISHDDHAENYNIDQYGDKDFNEDDSQYQEVYPLQSNQENYNNCSSYEDENSPYGNNYDIEQQDQNYDDENSPYDNNYDIEQQDQNHDDEDSPYGNNYDIEEQDQNQYSETNFSNLDPENSENNCNNPNQDGSENNFSYNETDQDKDHHDEDADPEDSENDFSASNQNDSENYFSNDEYDEENDPENDNEYSDYNDDYSEDDDSSDS